MNLALTPLTGLLLVELDQREDERGSFAEAWNQKAFEAKNYKTKIDQVNFSTSLKKGTFRGYHYQAAPAGQTKIVFCVRGAVLDMALDVRRGSRTYLQAFQVKLTPTCAMGLYIPPGFAHAWLSLEDDCQIVYFVEGAWSASHERGVRPDDPVLGFTIPGVEVVNKRDKTWPLLKSNA